MNPLIVEAVEALRSAGWTVKVNGKPQPLPASVVSRHSRLPGLAVEFFTNIQS